MPNNILPVLYGGHRTSSLQNNANNLAIDEQNFPQTARSTSLPKKEELLSSLIFFPTLSCLGRVLQKLQFISDSIGQKFIIATDSLSLMFSVLLGGLLIHNKSNEVNQRKQIQQALGLEF